MNNFEKWYNTIKVERQKGRKNKTINKKFINLCKKDQKEMKAYIAGELSKYYKNVISKDGFLYVKGKDNILLTAHMDTTNHVEYGKRKKVKDFYEERKDGKHIITSPQGIGGDDRCGIYVILEILERTDLRPSIIFNEDEEIGCVGSEKFANSKFIKDIENMYFLIQIDRRGSDDAVFYRDINEDFHKFVTESTGYVERSGSFTDICKLSPACGVSSVNLSSGYYNEHTSKESVVLEELENTLEKTIKLIKDGLDRKEKFEYKTYTPPKYNYYGDIFGEYAKYQYLNNKYDKEEDELDSLFKELENEVDNQVYVYIQYVDENGDEVEEMYEGKDENEAIVSFFMEHPNTSWGQVLDFSIDSSNDY